MTFSAKSQEAKIREMQPLIILGMHRSGTSLTVRLLKDMGIFLGNRLSRDAEDIYFQKINRRVYRSVGVRWGYIDPLVDAMQSEEFIARQTDNVLNELFPESDIKRRSKGIVKYFGTEHWDEIFRENPLRWGWKDPRSTVTFPIWLRVFPNACVLHILRNGIDVAISTHRRSLKQRRKIWKRVFPLDYCPITLDFDYCFRLWEKHITYVLEHQHLISSKRYLEVRYEDLLAEPEEKLSEIANFIGYPLHGEVLNQISKRVDRSRLDNSNMAREYRDQIPALLSSPILQKLGYSYELAETERLEI